MRYKRRIKINRRILIIIALIVSIVVCAYFSVSLHFILSKQFDDLLQINVKLIINTIRNNPRVAIIFVISEIIIASLLLLFSNKTKNIYHSDKVRLTDKIEVPKPVGEGQHGTSWWLNRKDYDKVFKYNIIDRNKDYNQIAFNSGGVIVNYERQNNIEKIYYIDDNIHILLVGSSGSGKSRSIIIPTITMLGLSRREYVY